MAIKPSVDHHDITIPQLKMLAGFHRRMDILKEIQIVEEVGGSLSVITRRDEGRTTLLITKSHSIKPHIGGVILFPIDSQKEDSL